MDDEPRDDDHPDVLALVLGQLDARGRAQAVEHVLACRQCRAEHDELAGSVSALLAAVPEVQPPLGFDQRVVTTLQRDRRGRKRWQRAALTAAAAAVLIVAVAGLVWRGTSDGGGRPTAGVAALEVVDSGRQVGTVSLGQVDGETVMVVALVGAPEGRSYRCRTTFVDGTSTESAPWPASNAAWIVPLPSGWREVRTVELVSDDTDRVWSAADFDPA
ncbi:MAG: hypothetical protein HZB15_11850 [Actinobacteria bacterium]|nr:hypothetical protein [Actinomycetota bacterium]